MLSDFDRARKAEKEAARQEAADAASAADTADDTEGSGPDEGEGSTGQGGDTTAPAEKPEQVVRSTNQSSRRDPAGENSPLGESAGASGMAPQSTDQPDIERERFRDRT